MGENFRTVELAARSESRLPPTPDVLDRSTVNSPQSTQISRFNRPCMMMMIITKVCGSKSTGIDIEYLTSHRDS
jgi:hypothetical protein